MTFWIAAGMILWFIAIVVLSVVALIYLFDSDNLTQVAGGVLAGAIAIAMFAALIAWSGESRLCNRGHEEYRLIGKTMQRVWVCDEYQGE